MYVINLFILKYIEHASFDLKPIASEGSMEMKHLQFHYQILDSPYQSTYYDPTVLTSCSSRVMCEFEWVSTLS